MLDPRPAQRTVTIGGAKRDRNGRRRRRGVSSDFSREQSWSVELACGRYFVSHLVIGSSISSTSPSNCSSSRRAHPHDFTLFESDWEATEQEQSTSAEERSNELPTSRRSASSSQQPPLVVRLVCHCYDVQVRSVDRQAMDLKTFSMHP